MTRALFKSCVCVNAVLFMAVMCSGCVSRHSYTKRQFVLETSRPSQPTGQSRDVVLAVRSFTVDPVCDSRGLLYRKGESEYESDFYNEFLIAPRALISSQTRKWLAQSGIFKTVLEPGSLIEATHILEGNVLALYGDFRGQSPPQAVIQIRVFLVAIKRSQPEVRLSGFPPSGSTDRGGTGGGPGPMSLAGLIRIGKGLGRGAMTRMAAARHDVCLLNGAYGCE